MKTKRVWGFLLSFALVLGLTSGAFGNRAAAEETAKKIVVYVAAEGKNANGDEVNILKTPVQVTEGSMAETAVTQVLDFYYKDNYVYGSSFLSSIGKVENADPNYWMFHVNGEDPHEGDKWYSIGDYPLKDQDRISLVYGDWQNLAAECSSYADDDSLIPDANAQAQLLENAKKQQSVLAKKIYEANFASTGYVPGITDTDGLYDVFSFVQADFHEGEADAFYDAVASKVVSELRALKEGRVIRTADEQTSYTLETYENNKYVIINYAKIALLLAALGQDITNAGGIDLTKKLTDKTNYDNANPTILTRESLILFAMDGTGAAWPTDNAVKREDIVNAIVNGVDDQIGFATDLSSAWGATLDSAAMAIQPLADAFAPVPENTEDATARAGFEKINRVITMLDVMQDKTGGYAGPNANPWTLAQVMTTAGLFQINPLSDTRVIRDGKTLFDASAQYVDTAKEEVNADLMGYAPAQLLRGLTSCIASAGGKDGLYHLKAPKTKATVTEYVTGTEPGADSEPADTPVAPTPEKNTCKKVVAEEKTYTIKKAGKPAEAVFLITASDASKKTTDKVTVKVKNSKIAKVTKRKLYKGKLLVYIKGMKKGSTVLT
ncbi:MAG: DUF4430 domain-containing protein, partial [Lachnospiraceae bacterium]|nr:DUF4430 domain-containing protein [Lachnospiraceae bacterium]